MDNKSKSIISTISSSFDKLEEIEQVKAIQALVLKLNSARFSNEMTYIIQNLESIESKLNK